MWLSARLRTVISRAVLVVSGTPAYAGTAVTADTPGTTSNDDRGLGARRGLVGTGRVEPRVAREQPDDPLLAGRVPDDELGS